MHLTIITVSYNVKDHLRECIHSVCTAAEGLAWEYIVVDNASRDGSADMVAREFPAVRLIRNTDNRGFGAANNQALAQARGDYVLLLNPDMRVFPDTLRTMLAFMQGHPDVGIASCQLLDSTGRVLNEVRRFPDLLSQCVLLFKLQRFFPTVVRRYECADLDMTREHDVDQVRGSFFMVRRECLEQVGLFDEMFFLWFEEVDYCKRAKNAGWKVVYTPRARAVDYKGRSFSQISKLRKRFWYMKSLLHYFKKHGITL